MLIERDYRDETATLAYTGEPFAVPSNVHIIGMMNTADRSLAMIDYALRRRFSFVDLEPGFDSRGFTRYREGLANPMFNELIERVKELNVEVTADPTLGKGFTIGHSYFCGATRGSATHEWLRNVVEYDIVPMIAEYWFDNDEAFKRWQRILTETITP